jgi:hypothetical protein
MKFLNFLPDRIFNKLFFLYKNKYWPNFKKPQSFNEKINYLKLHSKNPLRALVADRLKVRDYILKKAPECELIPILWKGDIFTQEVYESLPQKFVLKANHGSGMVKIVDKTVDDYEVLYMLSEQWKKIDYGKITRQSFYDNIEKIIIVEEFITFKGDVPPDFKFMSFNGKIEFIQIDIDRFSKHTRDIYDSNFNKLNFTLEYPNSNKTINKPKLFEKSKKIVTQLADDFDFIRVDLYILDDKIYFGELTNTPGNGYDRFIPKDMDFKFGKKIIFKKEFDYEN